MMSEIDMLGYEKEGWGNPSVTSQVWMKWGGVVCSEMWWLQR